MIETAVIPLTDVARFLDDWRSLYAARERRSFFLSPAWIDAWLAGRPSDGGLYEARGLQNGRLVLLGAVGTPASVSPPVLGARRAHLHEYGVDALDSIYIEDNDFLLAPDVGDEARAQAIAAITEATGAEEIVFRNCARPLVDETTRFAAAEGWRCSTLNVQPGFAVDLAAARADGAGALGKTSSALRAKINRALRRYQERGAVDLRVAQTDEDWTDLWDKLIGLHGKGWALRGEKGAFANPAFVAFHKRLRACAPDSLQLLELRAGEQTIGCLYNFLHQGRVLNYQSGFLYENDNQLTPGLLAHALAMQHYLEAGFDSYDLLAGDAGYKRRLAEQTTGVSTLVLEKRSVRSSLRNSFRRLARGAQRS